MSFALIGGGPWTTRDMAELGSVIRGRPVEQFWRTARGFWRGNTRSYAWGLIAFLVVCVILQLLVQYRLNLWNRDFFNALGRRDGSEIWQQARAVLSLVAQSVVLAIAAVWGRMSFQRRWRDWLTSRLILNWFSVGGEGDDKAGESEPQFIEYRIADDARIATDAPIDFAVGLLASVLTAGTFAAVLWNVGGSLSLAPFGIEAQVPGYLVLAAVLYAASTTTAMMVIGGNMASVIERKSQAESEFKFAVARLRENLMSRRGPATSSPDKALVVPVETSLKQVISQWRRLCGQHMRTTLVSHGNSLLAPLMGLLLCVPNYVHGPMQLGEMTQSAGAFVAVQGAFNWLVDNYPRLADWVSSAGRVGVLLASLEDAHPAIERGPTQQRKQREYPA
jgi:vitamin B12/bleomycin/antimicrobial peptide transport system ATP-binding/permease protein